MKKRVTEKQRDHLMGNDLQKKDRLHFHKDISADADSSEQLIARQLAEQFKRFDEAHPIEVPELHTIEQFVASSKVEIARRQKRDLFLFWLAALPLLSVMLWMLGQHTEWFIGVQIAAAAVGITGALVIAARSGRSYTERKQPRWNKN